MPVRHLETPDRYLGPRIKFLYHAFNRKFMEIARANGVEELTSMHGRILGYLYWSRPKDVYQKDIEEPCGPNNKRTVGIYAGRNENGGGFYRTGSPAGAVMGDDSCREGPDCSLHTVCGLFEQASLHGYETGSVSARRIGIPVRQTRPAPLGERALLFFTRCSYSCF